jgi:hypothetical protein
MLDFEGSVQKGKKGKGILHLEKGCLDGHRNISLRQSVWYVGIPDYLMTLHGKPLTTVKTQQDPDFPVYSLNRAAASLKLERYVSLRSVAKNVTNALLAHP